MRRLSSIIPAMLLCGCVTPPITLPQAEASCTGAPFTEYGRCIEAKFDAAYPKWRENTEADLAQAYLSWLNAAGDRINNGTMDEPTARMGAAELRTRLYQIVAQRRGNEAARKQIGLATMMNGLALMNSAQPSYSAPPLPPPQMITCTQSPPNPVTGQIRTVCQ